MSSLDQHPFVLLIISIFVIFETFFTFFYFFLNLIQIIKKIYVSGAGFEPALPKETDLESVALDHSAIGAYQNALWRFYEVLLTSFNKSGNC